MIIYISSLCVRYWRTSEACNEVHLAIAVLDDSPSRMPYEWQQLPLTPLKQSPSYQVFYWLWQCHREGLTHRLQPCTSVQITLVATPSQWGSGWTYSYSSCLFISDRKDYCACWTIIYTSSCCPHGPGVCYTGRCWQRGERRWPVTWHLLYIGYYYCLYSEPTRYKHSKVCCPLLTRLFAQKSIRCSWHALIVVHEHLR